MNYYQIELRRIRQACYSNEGQISTVIRTRKYIDSHFEKELCLDLLSKVGFTSKFHLLRLFKKYYGQTPKQYLTDRRMEKSREYLKKGLKVTDACFLVGFGCPSSFSTLFKNKSGVSPAEFQKRATFAKPV